LKHEISQVFISINVLPLIAHYSINLELHLLHVATKNHGKLKRRFTNIQRVFVWFLSGSAMLERDIVRVSVHASVCPSVTCWGG